MRESTWKAITENECPKCGAKPGDYCRQPSGRKISPARAGGCHFARRENSKQPAGGK